MRLRWILTLLCLSTAMARAALPLWEFGAGVSGVSLPDYRGSDQQRAYALPIPYFVYRGERINFDRRGLRGLLFARENVALNLSGDLGVPVYSDHNTAREGMPDLDLLVHVGPSLEFTLHKERDDGDVLKLKLPAEWVVDLNPSHAGTRGWFFYPHVNYIVSGRWNVGTAAGFTFATRDYHQYYYGVADRYATATRPAYRAPGGYSGARVSLTATHRIDELWIGGFIRYENLAEAAFIDSPLVRSHISVVTGIGVTWVFSRSSRAAPDTPLSEPDTM